MKLETKRLILRDWNEKDIDDLVEGLNNLQVSKLLVKAPYPYTKKDAENRIKQCFENDKKGEKRASYQFAIVLKSENKVIGGVSLEEINKIHGTAGGGIWINARYHGCGYDTKAFGERIKFVKYPIF